MATFSSMWKMMLALFLVASMCEAKEYLVGDSESSWLLPLTQAGWLNQWASNHRFMIGDSLSWKYDEGLESVLQVKEEHYRNCDMSNPIQVHNNGKTRVVLNRPGPFYFISGTQDHCEQGLKLHVRVLSEIEDCPSCLPALQQIDDLTSSSSSPHPPGDDCASCHRPPEGKDCPSCHVPKPKKECPSCHVRPEKESPPPSNTWFPQLWVAQPKLSPSHS